MQKAAGLGHSYRLFNTEQLHQFSESLVGWGGILFIIYRVNKTKTNSIFLIFSEKTT